MSKAKNYACANAKIRAHITQRPQKDGSTILYGYAINADTFVRIDGCIPHQRTAKRPEEIEATRKYLIGAIDAEYNKLFKKRETCQKTKEGFFQNVFNLVEDKSLLLSPKWSSSTADNRLSYFQRQILPRLDMYGPDICSEDLTCIRDDLIKKAATSKRGNQNANQATNSVGAYIKSGAYIYKIMRDILPDYGLPDIDLAGDMKPSNVMPEQCKALPDEIRVKLAALLLYRLSHIGQALGVSLMLFCGLRPAEAAAVLIGEIQILGNFGLLPVLFQVKNGIRTEILKSSAAYRITKLPYIAICLVAKYKDHLRNLGYSDDQISAMPLAPKRNTYDILCEGSDISAFARKLLTVTGSSDEFLQASITLMNKEPDTDSDGNLLQDTSAYVLRRDWCSRVSDICGLSRPAVDYHIGHENKDAKSYDFVTLDASAKTASQLERYVFLPEYSLNPAFRPISIVNEVELDLPPNMVYDIVAAQQTEEYDVYIDISGLEPGYPITIHLPHPAESIEPRKLPRDTPEARSIRPIIGQIHNHAYYDRLISEANEIDIQTLLH